MNKKSNLEKLLEGLFLIQNKTNLSILLEELYTDINNETAGAEEEEKEPKTPEEFVSDFEASVVDPVDPSEEIYSDEKMEDYLENRFEQSTTIKDATPANESSYGINEISENVYEQEEKSAGARAVM